MRKILLSSFSVFVIAFAAPAGGLIGNAKSLYSDHRAHEVGDVITIEIVEVAQASNEASTEIKKEQGSDVSISGSGPLDFIPLTGFQGDVKNDYSGEGKTTRKGKLKAKITARIIQVLPNGNLLIEGSRVVDVNGERQTTVLTGVIRPQDITPQNIVYSYNIADAQISYTGRGPVQTSQRPGFFAKLLNWIF
ncbi:MAG: flagellar basal body L-ring protein FlgH [candidate division Zixibacteria bacterium]|nr:flagellar basal body L-ring protein FlgH [Candidatus Tariuqbacter arcticus]